MVIRMMKAMPGVIFWPLKPLTITLNLSYPMTTIVMIDTVPDDRESYGFKSNFEIQEKVSLF